MLDTCAILNVVLHLHSQVANTQTYCLRIQKQQEVLYRYCRTGVLVKVRRRQTLGVVAGVSANEFSCYFVYTQYVLKHSNTIQKPQVTHAISGHHILESRPSQVPPRKL